MLQFGYCLVVENTRGQGLIESVHVVFVEDPFGDPTSGSLVFFFRDNVFLLVP
jgi:hypothetical protein